MVRPEGIEPSTCRVGRMLYQLSYEAQIRALLPTEQVHSTRLVRRLQ